MYSEEEMKAASSRLDDYIAIDEILGYCKGIKERLDETGFNSNKEFTELLDKMTECAEKLYAIIDEKTTDDEDVREEYTDLLIRRWKEVKL